MLITLSKRVACLPVILLASLGLSGCGGGTQSSEVAQSGSDGTKRVACEPPAPGMSDANVLAAVVDACMALMRSGVESSRESAWQKAADAGDPQAAFLLGLTALVHPDGRLRRFRGMESMNGIQKLRAAAQAGYAPVVYQLGKSWQRDRRRIETDEHENAVYASDAVLEVAAESGVMGAKLEIARKHVHWGVRYEELNMYPESRSEFDEARDLLAVVIASGEEPFVTQAGRLQRELN